MTGARLGARYRVYRPFEQRVADRVARLPEDLPAHERARVIEDVEAQERRRATSSAVAGFDLTFTMAKSASVLWALAPAPVQARIAAAHRDTVAEVMGVLERDALFTRTGHGGIAQVGTRGAVAACFDHWDTRAGDPCQLPAKGAVASGRDVTVITWRAAAAGVHDVRASALGTAVTAAVMLRPVGVQVGCRASWLSRTVA
jgi:hypothetical protein